MSLNPFGGIYVNSQRRPLLHHELPGWKFGFYLLSKPDHFLYENYNFNATIYKEV